MKLHRPEDWHRTNPDYQRSPPKQNRDGSVWIDGGACFDLACMGQPKAVIESWSGGPKPLGLAGSARSMTKTPAADGRVSRVAGAPKGKSIRTAESTAGPCDSGALL